jgi:hypothetical protein
VSGTGHLSVGVEQEENKKKPKNKRQKHLFTAALNLM